MINIRAALSSLLLLTLASCGGDAAGDPPAGSCKTAGTATGSYEVACNQCAQANCDRELREKAGPGWARQIFGGPGACAAFNACTCQCLASSSDPLQCGLTACAAKLDDACRTASSAAMKCLRDHCGDTCR